MAINLRNLNSPQLLATSGRRIKVPAKPSVYSGLDSAIQMGEIEAQQAEELARMQADTDAALAKIKAGEALALSDLDALEPKTSAPAVTAVAPQATPGFTPNEPTQRVGLKDLTSPGTGKRSMGQDIATSPGTRKGAGEGGIAGSPGVDMGPQPSMSLADAAASKGGGFTGWASTIANTAMALSPLAKGGPPNPLSVGKAAVNLATLGKSMEADFDSSQISHGAHAPEDKGFTVLGFISGLFGKGKGDKGMPSTTVGDIGTGLGVDAGQGATGPMGLAAAVPGSVGPGSSFGGGSGSSGGGASAASHGAHGGYDTSGEGGPGGGPSPSSGCIIISACTNPYSYEVNVTRAFRDTFLTPSMLRGYYALARKVVPFIKGSGLIRRAVKKILVDRLIDYGEYRLNLKPKRERLLSAFVSRGFLKLINFIGQRR